MTVLIACNSQGNNQPSDDTPKALTEDKSSTSLGSKKRHDDLLEKLYEELVSQNIALQNFEARVSFLNNTIPDSMNAFNEFNVKNSDYYGAAERQAGGIIDSMLKEKAKSLINASLANYTEKISAHTRLIDTIDSKSLTLADLHRLLKITRTISVIQFQNDAIPNKAPLEVMPAQLDKVIKQTGTLIKN